MRSTLNQSLILLKPDVKIIIVMMKQLPQNTLVLFALERDSFAIYILSQVLSMQFQTDRQTELLALAALSASETTTKYLKYHN
jgi:hypothetical protein